MIARNQGMVRIDGQRRMVRKGRTTAHAGHPIVVDHPNLWAPLRVDYPTPEPALVTSSTNSASSTDTRRGDNDVKAQHFAALLLMRDHIAAVAARLVEAVDAAASDPVNLPIELQAALTAVRDALTRNPDDYLVRTLDELSAEPVDTTSISDPPPVDAAAVRAWARGQGHDVPSRGRLPQEIIDAYRAANP